MPTFVNPSLLWALPLIAIPVLIYYLMRFRSLRVTWGANYVLERAIARLKKQLLMDQMLLLILRTLAALLLVLAFARPSSRGQADRVSGSGVLHVVLVDNSYSLDAVEGTRTRRAAALDMLHHLVGTWGRGEQWSLATLGSETRWLVDDATIGDTDAAVAQLAALPESGDEVAVSLAPALASVLARVGDRRAELYLVTDDQASAWNEVQATVIPANVTVYWLCPPLTSRANLAVTSLTPSHPWILAGHPTRVFARVRNFGPEPVQDAVVEFLLNGAFYGKETISLLPGQEGTVALDMTFDTPGSQAIAARVPKDALPTDNQAAAGVEVHDALRVLLLRAADREGKFQSAAGFLDLASGILTRKDGDGVALFNASPFATTIAPAEASLATLQGADVVLLDAGCPVTPALAATLRDYVADGGGLVLAPDETVDRDAWNSALGDMGLLPAPLAAGRIEALGGDVFQALAPSGFTAPALRSFEGRENGDLGRAKFYAWQTFGPMNPGATPLAAYADGSPFVLRQRHDLGSVTLLAGGLNGHTNSLIVSEAFYPLLVHLFSDAASGAMYPRTVERGQSLRLRLTGATAIKGVTFGLQDSAPGAITPRTVELPGGAAEQLAETTAPTRSGLGSMLVLRDGGSERVWFGIQGDRPDSDLTPLTPERIASLTTTLGVQRAATWDALDSTLRDARRGREWHAWVVAALLLALLGEMLLQRRFI